jgi:hypothetical protein
MVPPVPDARPRTHTRIESLSVAVSVRGNGILRQRPRRRNRFIAIQLAICRDKALVTQPRYLGHFTSQEFRKRGSIAQRLELAADNRLVGSSSPPSPTTQSHTNRDFRVSVTARFNAVVSARQNPVSRKRRPTLTETRSNAVTPGNSKRKFRSSAVRIAPNWRSFVRALCLC